QTFSLDAEGKPLPGTPGGPESSAAATEKSSSSAAPETERKTKEKSETAPKTEAKSEGERKTEAKEGTKADYPPLDYPPLLKKAWEDRDAYRTGNLHRVVPRSFRQLEGALVRVEQSWRARIP